MHGQKFLGQPILTIFITLGLLLNLALDLQGQHDATGMQRLEDDSQQYLSSLSTDSLYASSTSPEDTKLSGMKIKNLPNHHPNDPTVKGQKTSTSKHPIPLFTPHFGHGEFITAIDHLRVFDAALDKRVDGQTVVHLKESRSVVPPVPPPAV